MCDLDSVSVGPREWALVPTAHAPERFGRDRRAYHEFADAYGFDITARSGWPVLREVRELQLLTSVIDSLSGRPEVADQWVHRMRSFITGDDEVIWQRYR